MSSDDTKGQIGRSIAANAADLLAYFERRVGPSDAPDLLAEVMLAAWRRAAHLPEDPERARMWLFVTARHVLFNAQRGERRRWRLANQLRSLVGPPATMTDAGEGVEVREAIAGLTPELAELVRLIHWEGLSLVEAAEVLGIPASTARGRYQRAKGELRAALAVEVID